MHTTGEQRQCVVRRHLNALTEQKKPNFTPRGRYFEGGKTSRQLGHTSRASISPRPCNPVKRPLSSSVNMPLGGESIRQDRRAQSERSHQGTPVPALPTGSRLPSSGRTGENGTRSGGRWKSAENEGSSALQPEGQLAAPGSEAARLRARPRGSGLRYWHGAGGPGQDLEPGAQGKERGRGSRARRSASLPGAGSAPGACQR